ncbi:MAG: tRNA uridine-5-carboxymethylaminomethyl(34) synthesis GTPase MnmE [Clostridia bacterium]|nr:tRNA uridine-5-carboxymethylaminomethyl(34) synthesis GTPase MnmE [Clostridia bacterium]
MNIFSTIAAISTPYGTGGISIIRISGSRALEIADKVFKASSKKKIADVPSHTIHHGHIVSAEGKVLDEVLASVMLSPRTYTGEDTVELNCHGGLFTTKRILEEVLKAGAENASRGEFTKRAFLNGKTDLARAEAVIDLINSKTNLEQSISVNHLGGRLSKKINSLRERLLGLIAHVQVLIDYPDEELEPLSDDEFMKELSSIKLEASKLLATSEAGSLIKNGIKTAIVGKPNVGKSSLLNLLSGEEKAIVTDIEGTTRDAIEECVSLGGISLNLVDTAGIRETEDKIEAIGVKKSKEYIEKSKLIIFVADAASGIDENDIEIIESLKDKKCVALINKCDKAKLKDESILKENFDRIIHFSAKTSEGLDKLEQTIKEMFEIGEIENNSDIITNARHKDALIKAQAALSSAIESAQMGISADTLFIDIEDAISALGEIVGLTVSEEVVDRIFHSFCVGK